MNNAALDKAVALSDAMIWLEVRSEEQALTIIDHINQQAERIAELEKTNQAVALVSKQMYEASRLVDDELVAERDALRAEVERLKAWRTWGKNVALPALNTHGYQQGPDRCHACQGAIARAPKESPQIPDGSPDAWVPRS